jgi:hypothetical protein
MPFFQFSFLCVVALANLCLGFAIASRLGFGPPLGLFFQLETTIPACLPKSPELESKEAIVAEPVVDEEPTDNMTTGTAAVPSQEEPVHDAPEV